MNEPMKPQNCLRDEKRLSDRRTWAWAVPLAIIGLAVIAFLYLS